MKNRKPHATITSSRLIFDAGSEGISQPYSSSLVEVNVGKKEGWLHVFHLHTYTDLDDAIEAVNTFEFGQSELYTDFDRMLSKLVTKQNKTKKQS